MFVVVAVISSGTLLVGVLSHSVSIKSEIGENDVFFFKLVYFLVGLFITNKN